MVLLLDLVSHWLVQGTCHAGTWLPTWRRRWFILKGGKLLWFKDNHVTAESQPRGVIEVCL